MKQLRKIIENSPKTEFFPVLGSTGELLGVVRLEQITPVLFDPQFAETMLVFDLMETPRIVLDEDDDLSRAVSLLEKTSQDNLPVKKRNGKFMGFVSAADIFKLYRGLVREADSF